MRHETTAKSKSGGGDNISSSSSSNGGGENASEQRSRRRALLEKYENYPRDWGEVLHHANAASPTEPYSACRRRIPERVPPSPRRSGYRRLLLLIPRMCRI